MKIGMQDKISDSDLDVRWFYRNKIDQLKKIKTFVVICVCGNEKLILAPAALRCSECGKAHTYENFLRQNKRAESFKKMGDGQRGRITQWGKLRRRRTMIVDGRTRKAKDFDLPDQYKAVILKQKPIISICPKCKKKYVYTGAHNLAGFSAPLIVVDQELACWDCVRNKFGLGK